MKSNLTVGLINIFASMYLLVIACIDNVKPVGNLFVGFAAGLSMALGIKYICDYVDFRRNNSNTRK